MSIFSKIADGIKVATQIVPHAIDLVKAFEVPEAAGKGVDKKEAVVAIIKAVLPDDIEAAIGGDKTIQLIGTIIDVVVKFLNAIGIFKK